MMEQINVSIPSSTLNSNSNTNSFDDINFGTFRENNTYCDKENLLEILTLDIINFINEYSKYINSNNLAMPNELYIGYIVYSKIDVTLGKLANILNLLIQNINPNIRIQSQWNIEGKANTSIQTIRGIENIDTEKIKIKVIIRPNDKDMAIKKITEIAIDNMNKNSKKLQSYLKNYKKIILPFSCKKV